MAVDRVKPLLVDRGRPLLLARDIKPFLVQASLSILTSGVGTGVFKDGVLFGPSTKTRESTKQSLTYLGSFSIKDHVLLRLVASGLTSSGPEEAA